MASTPNPKPQTPNLMKLSVYLLPLILLLIGCQNEHDSSHHDEIAERGEVVMGFDLDRSTHVFEKIEMGGRQQVLSDDRDAEQIQLIQAHMQEIAEQFTAGNFHGPEMIHGEHMPGLHELMMGHDEIQIEYSSLELGGQIMYTTENLELVGAIHDWFDAQVADHGHHAQGHH